MQIKLSITQKILLTIFCFGIAMVCFMIKLPSAFRHNDRELHNAFYFLAAAFLNILFVKKNLLLHIAIFCLLYIMGIAIEHAQEYSNSYFHKTIHGRYDPEDVKANLKGLIWFSVVWVPVVLLMILFKPSPKEK